MHVVECQDLHISWTLNLKLPAGMSTVDWLREDFQGSWALTSSSHSQEELLFAKTALQIWCPWELHATSPALGAYCRSVVDFPMHSGGSCSLTGNLIKLYLRKHVSFLFEGLWNSAVPGKGCCGMVGRSMGWQGSCLNLWCISFKTNVSLNSAQLPWPLQTGKGLWFFLDSQLSPKSADLDLLVTVSKVPMTRMCFHSLGVLHTLEKGR